MGMKLQMEILLNDQEQNLGFPIAELKTNLNIVVKFWIKLKSWGIAIKQFALP
jgi:hypothetical protein